MAQVVVVRRRTHPRAVLQAAAVHPERGYSDNSQPSIHKKVRMKAGEPAPATIATA